MFFPKQPYDNLCHAYLKQLYRYHQSSRFQQISLENTQGDVFLPSMSLLIHKMGLTSNDVFIDLGSGIGRVVFHAFLLSNAKKIIGIEMHSALHQIAIQKKERILTELPYFFTDHRDIDLVEGDFLETSFNDATAAFISAVCFSQATLQRLAEKLDQLPALRSIFSLKPLTYLSTLHFHQTIRVQCSWGSALCYQYKK